MRQMFSKNQLINLIKEKNTTFTNEDVKYLMEHPEEVQIIWDYYDGGILAVSYWEEAFQLFKVDNQGVKQGTGYWDEEEQSFFFEEYDVNKNFQEFNSIDLRSFNFSDTVATIVSYASMTEEQKSQIDAFLSNIYSINNLKLKINNAIIDLELPQISSSSSKYLSLYYSGKLYVLSVSTISKDVLMTPYTLS